MPPDMEAETGCRYAAFISLGGSPLYRHLLSQYHKDRSRARFVFVLAADAPDLELDPIEEGYTIEVIRLDQSNSIAETVLAGLDAIQAEDAVVVHMADTLLDLEGLAEGDSVYVQTRSDLYRWTSVVSDDQGRVTILGDRDQERPLESQSVCVGLFSFRNGKTFADALRGALRMPDSSREPFFAALEAYSTQHSMKLRTVARWFDCGHVDTYYESRLGYQNLRHFNTLTYEPSRGQVTKTSSDFVAFRHQVRWFKQVPDELGAYLPRIFSSSDGNEPFITMELLSIPTLGDLFTTQRLSLGAWNGVVRTISHIQSRFEAMATRSALATQLARSVYLDKTHTRLAQFAAQQPGAAGHWVVHGDERWTLDRVRETLDRYVERTGLLGLEKLTPIHGDFCFSNLLYDTKVRLVKMIDPRGEFGVPGIFGDRRYDLAKLAHSYGGGYDFIVADRFSVKVEVGGKLQACLHADSYHAKVRSIFEAVLLPDPALRREVDALQALLFLSMIPLHVDKPRRQLAMLATGLGLYARAWQDAGGRR